MIALLPALLMGCPQTSKPAETIYISDVNNYSYSAAIDLGTNVTAMGEDITFHWDDLSADIQTHPVDSCDEIDDAYLIWFQYLTKEELEAKIVCGDIKQSDTDVIVQLESGEGDPSDCQASMSELSVVSNFFDPAAYYIYDTGVWFVRLTTGTAATRMLTTITPDASSDVTDVNIDESSSTLEFTVDLTSLTQPVASASAAGYTVDWSTLLEGANADGCEPAEINEVDQLWIARFDSATVADLEADFINLEYIADEIWTADAGARTSVELTEAVSLTSGSAFTDFSGGGTWVLALRSTISENPAPLLVTILAVE